MSQNKLNVDKFSRLTLMLNMVDVCSLIVAKVWAPTIHHNGQKQRARRQANVEKCATWDKWMTTKLTNLKTTISKTLAFFVPNFCENTINKA